MVQFREHRYLVNVFAVWVRALLALAYVRTYFLIAVRDFYQRTSRVRVVQRLCTILRGLFRIEGDVHLLVIDGNAFDFPVLSQKVVTFQFLYV